MLNTTLEHKSALAKLLATENLKVQYSQKYPTAFFDLNTRTVHIPLIHGLDEDILDLFAGHEVGHGRETPSEGWHSAIKQNEEYSNAFKSYLNVVEDIRIERKIKDEYPGLKRPFMRAYKKLVDKEFFGPDLINRLKTMNFIDRLNIHTKVGSNVYVEFNKEEQALVDEALTLETWDEVVAYAQKIFDRQRDKNKDEKKQGKEQGAETFVQDESGKNEDQTESDEQDKQDQDSPSDSDDRDGNQPEKGSEDTDVAESETDKSFREAEQKMYNDAERKKQSYNYSAPGTVKIDTYNEKNLVFQAKELIPFLDARLREEYSTFNRGNYSYDNMISNQFAKYREQNSAYVNFLVKEFEMRKNAKILNRGKTSKSGKLDVNRLHKYRLSNDVFQRVMSFPEGKNHGMIMYIDLSGSMTSTLDAVINQVLILAEFCKKVNIPFRVFGFTENSKSYRNMIVVNYNEYRGDPKEIDVIGYPLQSSIHRNNHKSGYASFNEHFHLKEYISSELRPQDYKKAFNNLLVLKAWYEMSRTHRYRDDTLSKQDEYPLLFMSFDNVGEQLSSTPLNDAIVLSVQLTNKFVAKYGVENMVNIFLSDGDSDHSDSFMVDQVGSSGYPTAEPIHKSSLKAGPSIIEGHGVRHLVDKPTVKCWSTNHYLQFARKATNAKYIGFFLVSYAPSVIHCMASCETKRNISLDYKAISNILKAKFRKEGYLVSGDFGYDVQFFISCKTTIMNDVSFDDDSWWKQIQDRTKQSAKSKNVTTNAIAKGFSSQQTKKQLNRIMLIEFTKAIAEAA